MTDATFKIGVIVDFKRLMVTDEVTTLTVAADHELGAAITWENGSEALIEWEVTSALVPGWAEGVAQLSAVAWMPLVQMLGQIGYTPATADVRAYSVERLAVDATV